MKKNVLIFILSLIIVGGGCFVAGEKLREKNVVPETTAGDSTAEMKNEDVTVSQATEKVIEEATVPVTEKVVAVTEQKEEPKTEAVNSTEKTTESATRVNNSSEEVKTTTETVNKISREAAKKIALSHAGLKESDVKGIEIELDFENGAYEYEVSFESGKYDYDYDIDAVSGKINFSEKDLDD